MRRMIFSSVNMPLVHAAREWATKFQINAEVAGTSSDLVEALREDKDRVAILWGADGLHAVQQIRAIRDSHARNLIFTIMAPLSHNASSHRAMALNAGADDCQTWPIDAQEFVERYWSLCRRERMSLSRAIKFGGLEFFPDSGVLASPSGEFQFPKREAELLSILASRPDVVVPHDLIMWELYRTKPDRPDPEICKVLITRIRKRLAGASGGLDFIESVWGRGYRFEPLGYEPQRDAQNRRIAG